MALFKSKAHPKRTSAAAAMPIEKGEGAKPAARSGRGNLGGQPEPSTGGPKPNNGIWGEMVDATARAFGFPQREAFIKADAQAARADTLAKQNKGAKREAVPSRRIDAGRATAEAARLAGEGLERVEIARRTGLSQDTIGLLIHLAPSEAVETAAGGTFFRILQARIGA